MLLVFIPVIGAATGWVIMALLLKMLFWPREPVKMPGGVIIRGLLPQKQDELSTGIREIVKTQLRFAVTADNGLAPDILDRLTNTVAFAAREHVYQRTPAIIPKAVKLKVADLVEDFIKREMPGYTASLTNNMQKQDFSAEICRWAQDKIRSFDLTELEYKLNCSREVFYMKAGAITIGLVSGLLQLLVVWAA